MYQLIIIRCTSYIEDANYGVDTFFSEFKMDAWEYLLYHFTSAMDANELSLHELFEQWDICDDCVVRCTLSSGDVMDDCIASKKDLMEELTKG